MAQKNRSDHLKPQAAAVYVRISEDRGGRGLGVERQRADCVDLADRLGWLVAGTYVENDVSAYSGKRRQEYERLLQDITRRAIDGLLVWHPDRLHRSPTELEAFISLVEATGVQVATVQAGAYDLTTPTGRMQARIVGAVARHESEHKAERIRRKHRELAERGLPPGGPRGFGYLPGRTGLVNDEATLIVDAANRVLNGASLRSIVREWNSSGYSTTRGNPWRAEALRNLLTSEMIAGKRGPVKGTWPALVDEVTHQRLVALIRDPARRTVQGPRKLLSGTAVCGVCGHGLVSRQRKYQRLDEQGQAWVEVRPGYVCHAANGGCAGVSIFAEQMETDVIYRMFAVISATKMAEAVAHSERSPSNETRVEELVTTGLELARMLGDGRLSPQEFAAAKASNDKSLAVARASLTTKVDADRIDRLRATSSDLEARWENLSIEEQRQYLGAFIARIIVKRSPRVGFHWYDPHRIEVVWKTGRGRPLVWKYSRASTPPWHEATDEERRLISRRFARNERTAQGLGREVTDAGAYATAAKILENSSR